MKHVLVLLLVLSTPSLLAAENRPFTFEYQELTYAGEIMQPQSAAKGMVVIIPGHGPTEFVEGDEYQELRAFLVAQQYSVAYWDKAGCGLSEGEYDHNQSIESSADEALAAIEAIQELDVTGADKLGFWSISRGGWIVPKISESFDGMRFWISISGTTAIENSRYMLEANLKAEKRTPEQIALLMSEWDDYQRILVRGGTLEDFNASTQNLMADAYYNGDNFQMTAEILANIQGFFGSGAFEFDDQTNQIVMYPDLESTLRRLSIPVIAILGRLDSQIDWQATGALYERAAQAGGMQLDTVYLDNCNHVMQTSVTGALYEDLPPDTPACAGYYDAMRTWLQGVGAGEAEAP
ncbi:MAG: alpha/beta hydrolase [Pseudomonadota bacterium]